VCPTDLQKDWVEATLVQWFATGSPFRHVAEKWDLKCEDDEKFYRLTLRPNLDMRFNPPDLGSTEGVRSERKEM
jgi:hypothetical protein